jgi:hypothetical protein
MSKLSATAMPFVPVAQLLQQFNSLVEQIKIKLNFVDMQISSALQKQATDKFFSSVPISQLPIHTSLPSNNARNFKRYLRSKAWRDRQCKIVHPLPTSRSSQTSSSTFIKYLHDYKKGKFKSVNDTIISTSKEGGVISAVSPSDVPSSIILNSSLNLPFHDTSDTSDISVKSGVIIISTSPQVRCLPRNPPQSRLPSVSNSSSSLQSINFNAVPIPAWPSHYSKVFKLYNSSSFNEKGCIIPEPDLIDIGRKLRDKDTSLTLPEYFRYSLFHCSTAFCRTHLKCCVMCGLRSHSDKRILCFDSCSDCLSPGHCFLSCPKLLSWLHNSKTRYHSKWLRLVTEWISSNPPPDFKN